MIYLRKNSNEVNLDSGSCEAQLQSHMFTPVIASKRLKLWKEI